MQTLFLSFFLSFFLHAPIISFHLGSYLFLQFCFSSFLFYQLMFIFFSHTFKMLSKVLFVLKRFFSMKIIISGIEGSTYRGSVWEDFVTTAKENFSFLFCFVFFISFAKNLTDLFSTWMSVIWKRGERQILNVLFQSILSDFYLSFNNTWLNIKVKLLVICHSILFFILLRCHIIFFLISNLILITLHYSCSL